MIYMAYSIYFIDFIELYQIRLQEKIILINFTSAINICSLNINFLVFFLIFI